MNVGLISQQKMAIGNVVRPAHASFPGIGSFSKWLSGSSKIQGHTLEQIPLKKARIGRYSKENSGSRMSKTSGVNLFYREIVAWVIKR